MFIDDFFRSADGKKMPTKNPCKSGEVLDVKTKKCVKPSNSTLPKNKTKLGAQIDSFIHGMPAVYKTTSSVTKFLFTKDVPYSL